MDDPKDQMTIVVFSGELDRAMAVFSLATTAASMGKQVTLFFTFWGINVLRKPGPSSGRGWIRWLLGRMNRGGADNLPLSRFQMGGLGAWMMKKRMREVKVVPLADSVRTAKEMGVRFVACTMSMGVMGIEKTDLIPEVDEFAGAATYLGEAFKSDVNLFI